MICKIKEFYEKFPVFVICFIIFSMLSCLDMMSTYLALSIGAQEGNPIIRFFIENTGYFSPVFFYLWQAAIFSFFNFAFYFIVETTYLTDPRYILRREDFYAIRNIVCFTILLIMGFAFIQAIIGNFSIFFYYK